MRPLLFLLLAGFLGLVAGRSAAGASPWRDAPSDLPDDPAIVYGRLANGVRYAVMHHETPKGRVSLRLLVAAGSLLITADDVHQFFHQYIQSERRTVVYTYPPPTPSSP